MLAALNLQFVTFSLKFSNYIIHPLSETQTERFLNFCFLG